jgi:hypothetical protein
MSDPTPPPAPAAAPSSVEDAGPTTSAGPAASEGSAAAAPSLEPETRIRDRLLEIAAGDNANAARYVQSMSDFARRGELLIQEVPNKYLELVDGMRRAVRAFNDALAHPSQENPIPIIRWHETPNLALRDPFTGDGMMVRVSRLHSHCELVLRYVSRNLKPDVPIIEGYGDFGVQGVRRKVMIRIEGWVENGALVYWYSLDFKRREIPISEVPDRIVMAVAKSDYQLLSRDLSTVPLGQASKRAVPPTPEIP